jgi:hypothetical protein
MKRKLIFIFAIIICLCFIPLTVSAASPQASLTVDGVFISNYPSVQAAVDAVTTTPGAKFLIEVAAGTVTDALNIVQQLNKSVVLRPQPGAAVTFTNTINIDGNGQLNNPETLLIEGFIFDLSAVGSPANCIYFVQIPPNVGHCYPHNVSINGCTFMGIFDTTVAVQSVPGGMRNISIMNCTATDMHSLGQLKAVSGNAFIQNCIVNNASSGVNFYGTGNLIVDSCVFNVVGYAVRSGQGAGVIMNTGSVTINNSVLNSNSTDDATIVLRGDSTKYISIIHSDITNAAAGGSFIENLNAASEGLYDINIVESNVTGDITGILLTTINTIDDPNVENGPINITITPDSYLVIIITILVILIALLLAVFFYYFIFGTSAVLTEG